MTMFNWNGTPDQRLVSPYIWAYFVAMVPLTSVVIGLWWWWTRRSKKAQKKANDEEKAKRVDTFME